MQSLLAPCQTLHDAKAAATLLPNHPCFLLYAVSFSYSTIFCSSSSFTILYLQSYLLPPSLSFCFSLVGLLGKYLKDE